MPILTSRKIQATLSPRSKAGPEKCPHGADTPKLAAVPRQIVNVDALKAASAEFTTMRGLAMRFRGLLRGRSVEKLDVWLPDARRSGIYGMQRFARALRHDIEAVRNAVLEPWSNGQTDQQAQDAEADHVRPRRR